MLLPKPREIVDMDVSRLEPLLQRLESSTLAPDDRETLRQVLESYLYVTQLIDQKSTTISRLRKLLFGAATEKTANVVGPESSGIPEASPTANTSAAPSPAEVPAPRKPGHGRHGAEDFPGAERVRVTHATLTPGDRCLSCARGVVYEVAAFGTLLRFVGQPPIQAVVYELQKLRCNLCGEIFTASSPAGVGGDKYDATVGSMIGLLKYGTGVPFYRLDNLQGHLEVPLPASTQWELVEATAEMLVPAHEELIRQAAQGEVVHNDDTTIKILSQAAARREVENAAASSATPEKERKGTFTTGVIANGAGRRIGLFFTGRKHAGENLLDILEQRAADLPPPIQMCDALSRNYSTDLKTILANCLAHARRQFVDVYGRFPSQCGYVLKVFEQVYHVDAVAREERLSAEERLHRHQRESGPLMEKLLAWLKQQFEDRLVEPNSGLGAAINYLRGHWTKLTLFLRVAGAPLDNNIVERALKKAILHRKNALFYKTQHGADVGDLFMSLIHTCELNGANPFDYLTHLQRHASAVAAHPEEWLPWNYRDAVAAITK